MTSAIYYQKSAVVQEEFKLIEVTTLRELEVEKLQKVIREVKEKRRACDEAAILETFALFNRVRETTIDLIRCVSTWQDSFTRPIRPQLLDCDYIIVRLINHIDFINSSELKRQFNFQFFRGNVLLLPFLNPKTAEPVRVSTALGKEIKKFASPSEETVVFCYQFLINCLPDDVYENKLAPLKRWLMQSWVPRVWVLDTKPVAAPPPLRKQASSGSLGAGKASQAGSTTTGEAEGTSRLIRRRSTVGSGSGKSLGSHHSNENKKATAAPTKMKRRNQMQAEEAAQAGNLAIQPSSPVYVEKDLQAQQLEEYARQQQLKREKEADQLDTYFKEMELLFIPTLGRRAVQTIAVGGTRQGAGANVQEFFHQPDKIVFHHTLQEERDQLAQVVQNTVIPANAKRANAEIVAKRNRLMADRGKPTSEIQYMTASGKRFPAALKKTLSGGIVPTESNSAPTSAKLAPTDDSEAGTEELPGPPRPVSSSSAKETAALDPPREGATEGAGVTLPATAPSSASAAPPLVGILYNPSSACELAAGADDALGGETAESRKFRRRESRRMSDLTISFSINDGHTVNDELERTHSPNSPSRSPNRSSNHNNHNNNRSVRANSPNKGQSARSNAFSARNTGSPSKRSPNKQSQATGIAMQGSPSGRNSAASSPTNASQRNRSTGTPPSGSRHSKAGAGSTAGTNIYGNKVRAETPPPASSSLALSTKDMRMWFAQQEQLDVHSQSTH